MDKIKKITTYSIALAFLVFLTFTLCMASYLFDKEKVKNEFTVGIQSSHIEEEFEPYDKFEEGQSYTKKVSVINDGTVPCYIRVFAEVEDQETRNNTDINYNTEDWIKSGVYYYCKDIVKAGESTTPLFTTVTAKRDVFNFNMICSSESVQADGYAGFEEAFAALDGGRKNERE